MGGTQGAEVAHEEGQCQAGTEATVTSDDTNQGGKDIVHLVVSLLPPGDESSDKGSPESANLCVWGSKFSL